METVAMDYLASSDSELLGGWASRRCADSLRALIERYAGLVYLAAWRAGGGDSVAMDASREVFSRLAREAGRFGRCPSLAGWLHGTTVAFARRLAANPRPDAAKSLAVQTAMECRKLAWADAWGALAPAIDRALTSLAVKDRDMLLQKYYRMRGDSMIASVYDMTAPAAHKRIEQATAALRRELEKAGGEIDGPLAGILAAGFAADAAAGASLAGVLVGPAMTAAASTKARVSAIPSMAACAVIIPAGAVAGVCAVWWAAQARTIAALESDLALLQQTAATMDITTEAAKPAFRPPITPLDERPVDWAIVARQLRQSRADAPVNPMAALEARIAVMSADEIHAALDEIALADLAEEDRERLQQRLCRVLAATPGGHRAILDRFLPDIGKGFWAWTLGDWLGDWLDADADAAVDWLSRHSPQILELGLGFIPRAFYPRLASRPDLCLKLLSGIQEERRLHALSSPEIGALNADQQAGWAHVIRSAIPDAERSGAIVWPVMQWAEFDVAPMSMAEVDAYLECIEAHPEEIGDCLLTAAASGASATRERASAFATDDTPDVSGDGSLAAWIEDLRAWIGGYDAGLVNRATGHGLASPIHDFAEASAIALHYHQADPDDDLLIPLLMRGPGDPADRPLARQLAARLADPGLRARFLEKFHAENP